VLIPLIVFGRPEFTGHERILVGVPLSIVLATFSYFFIEQSFRKSKSLGNKPKNIPVYFAMVLISAFILTSSNLVYNSANNADAQIFSDLHERANRAVNAEFAYNSADSNNISALHREGYNERDLCYGAIAIDHLDICEDVFNTAPLSSDATQYYSDAFMIDNCFLTKAKVDSGVAGLDKMLCTFGDTDADRYILVVGDSHAVMLLPALDIIAKHHKYKILGILGSGGDRNGLQHCSPVGVNIDKTCSIAAKAHQDYALELAKDASLIIMGFIQNVHRSPYDMNYNGMAMLLKELPHKPIVIEDSPVYDDSQMTECLTHGQNCTGDADAYDNQNLITVLEKDFPDSFTTIPMKSRYCDGDQYSRIIGGASVYTFSNHISQTYSITLAPWIEKQLGTLL
jgi:hypothetical protein